jgi:hypothetical protein
MFTLRSINLDSKMDLSRKKISANSFFHPFNKIHPSKVRVLLMVLLAVLYTSFLVSSGTPVWAQDDITAPAPLQKPVTIWADGITEVADLDAYKQAGFNTVVIRIAWQTSNDGQLKTANLDATKRFASEAANRKLRVIYALPAAPQGFERSMRLSVDSQAYSLLWSTWVEGTINSLSNTPNLSGWMLPDDPRSLPIFDDLGFQKWISQNFANIDVVNRQWGANYQELDDITIYDVGTLVARFRTPIVVDHNFTYDDLNSRIAESKQTESGLAFHPAALSLAAYKWDTYRALMTMWVGAIRGADGGKNLLFSGQLPDYAQIMSQPEGIDVIMPSIVPGVAENDIVTHNPQAIDMARRAGKFSALPVFSAQESVILPKEALPDLVGRWMETACTRGAMGIGFDSWDSIKNNIALMTAISERLKKLSSPSYSQLWGENPVATTAVLITPLADGATVRFGNSTNEQLRGLYGFGDDLVLGEPSNLTWAFRWGTSFGSIDYLSPDDLDIPLDHYTTIFAPQLLSCPLEVSARLANYVFAGGTLVSDLGVGALQNGGQANGMPLQMAQLFGVSGNYEIRQTTFNLSGFGQHELIPIWSNKIGIRNGLLLTNGDGIANSAFGGPVGYTNAPIAANVIAAGPPITVDKRNTLRTELTVQRSGRGYAIFAPFRLWQFWRPGYTGFNEFHGDLIARGSTLAMRTSAIVPQPMNQPEGQTLFPEVVNRAKQIALLNHDAPGQPVKYVAFETAGVGDWLWNGSISHFLNRTNVTLGAGRPAPISGANDFESRTRLIALFTQIPAGESAVMEMVPIAIQNLQGGPIAATATKLESPYLELNVWPNASDVIAAGGVWQPVPGPASPFRVTIYNSEAYAVRPNTRYRVTATDFMQPTKKGAFLTTEKTFTSDEHGKLVLELSGGAVQVKVNLAPQK